MTRQRWLGLLRIALALTITAAVLLAVAASWDGVRASLAQVSPQALALSSGCAVLGLVGILLGWRVLLTDLGSRLPWGPAAGVLFVGQLGKYLPGTLWTVVAQAEMASKFGVPRQRSAVAGLASVAMSALAALAIGLLALPGLANWDGINYGLIAALVPVGLVCLHPRILNWGVNLLAKLARRPPLSQQFSAAAIAAAMAAFAAGWLFLGAHAWILAIDLGADPRRAFVAAVFGYPLAAAVGMLAVLLPAGAGVRELVLVLLLTGPLDRSAALAVALLSRFIVVIGDVLAAAIGAAYGRGHDRKPPTKPV